jgi:NH3-dependent NAD+ synthetase
LSDGVKSPRLAALIHERMRRERAPRVAALELGWAVREESEIEDLMRVVRDLGPTLEPTA